MVVNGTGTMWEDRLKDDKQDVANMDKDDFLDRLIESRTVEGS